MFSLDHWTRSSSHRMVASATERERIARSGNGMRWPGIAGRKNFNHESPDQHELKFLYLQNPRIRDRIPYSPGPGVQANCTLMVKSRDRWLWFSEVGATLASSFGFLALVLAGVGIYGVMSNSIQGHRENPRCQGKLTHSLAHFRSC